MAQPHMRVIVKSIIVLAVLVIVAGGLGIWALNYANEEDNMYANELEQHPGRDANPRNLNTDAAPVMIADKQPCRAPDNIVMVVVSSNEKSKFFNCQADNASPALEKHEKQEISGNSPASPERPMAPPVDTGRFKAPILDSQEDAALPELELSKEMHSDALLGASEENSLINESAAPADANICPSLEPACLGASAPGNLHTNTRHASKLESYVEIADRLIGKLSRICQQLGYNPDFINVDALNAIVRGPADDNADLCTGGKEKEPDYEMIQFLKHIRMVEIEELIKILESKSGVVSKNMAVKVEALTMDDSSDTFFEETSIDCFKEPDSDDGASGITSVFTEEDSVFGDRKLYSDSASAYNLLELDYDSSSQTTDLGAIRKEPYNNSPNDESSKDHYKICFGSISSLGLPSEKNSPAKSSAGMAFRNKIEDGSVAFIKREKGALSADSDPNDASSSAFIKREKGALPADSDPDGAWCTTLIKQEDESLSTTENSINTVVMSEVQMPELDFGEYGAIELPNGLCKIEYMLSLARIARKIINHLLIMFQGIKKLREHEAVPEEQERLVRQSVEAEAEPPELITSAGVDDLMNRIDAILIN